MENWRSYLVFVGTGVLDCPLRPVACDLLSVMFDSAQDDTENEASANIIK